MELLIFHIGSVSNGAQFLLSGECLAKFSSVMEKDDTVRYRVYEVNKYSREIIMITIEVLYTY